MTIDPQTQETARRLLQLGAQLPKFLLDLPIPYRFQAVGMLYALKPMPNDLLLRMLLFPQTVDFAVVGADHATVEKLGSGWHQGDAAEQIAKVNPASAPNNDGIMDALLATPPLEQAEQQPQPADYSPEAIMQVLRSVVDMPDGTNAHGDAIKLFKIASMAENFGVNVGEILGAGGLDWPPGSGNYHGHAPPPPCSECDHE